MTAAAVDEQLDETPGAFYPGLTHSLYGESESGKSLIAQWAVIEQLAAGQRVLYVDFESNADQIVPRLVALAAGYGMDHAGLRSKVAAGLLDYVAPQGRITQTFIDGYLTPGRYAMAIVDGVTAALSMWGAKSSSGDEFTAWHHDLPERIARMTGAAVIVVDHVNKSGGRSRFPTETQAKIAVLTGAGFLVDVERSFAPGRPGSVIMLVGKDRPGDVRAHAGEVAPDRLQPWARVTVDGAKDGTKITLAIEPVDDDEALDDPPGTSGFDVPNWKHVTVPDEVSRELKGKGSGRASDVVRVLWAVGTEDGLTEAAVRAAWTEGQGDMGKNATSRWREAWACAMRSKGLAHGSGGASRWTLANHFEAMLERHNVRP